MVTNKDYCMSSYLTFRYVYDEKMCFKTGIVHHDHSLIQKKIQCRTAEDIDKNIRSLIDKLGDKKMAVMLSGGMDSAILASYLPKGTKAFTAKCIGENAVDESEQAKKYCDIYGLEHIVVEVSWDDYDKTMDELMLEAGTPIIPNEPQSYKISKMAKEMGIDVIVFGDCADSEFGGMDKMLSRDWKFEEWIDRFTFVKPESVLVNPKDMRIVYENYRENGDNVDFIKFIKEVYTTSASGAYTNAFRCANIDYLDPYEFLCMAEPLDLKRVRNGESKYLIRELFKKRYPTLEVPEKKPMSRPAEAWMRNWNGPKRDEFKDNCIDGLTGEQKLLVYSLERFLNLIDA